MFNIQSERILLIALKYEDLLLLSQHRNTLEASLGLTLSNFKLNYEDSFMKDFDDALEKFIIPSAKENPDSFQWFTHWLIVNKADKTTAGGIGVFGLPDKNGETILGYFIDEKYEGKGIATEAVKYLSAWLFENPKLKAIVAYTLAEGFGSQRVLQKNGFVFEGETEDGLKWRKGRAIL